MIIMVRYHNYQLKWRKEGMAERRYVAYPYFYIRHSMLTKTLLLIGI